MKYMILDTGQTIKRKEKCIMRLYECDSIAYVNCFFSDGSGRSIKYGLCSGDVEYDTDAFLSAIKRRVSKAGDWTWIKITVEHIIYPGYGHESTYEIRREK